MCEAGEEHPGQLRAQLVLEASADGCAMLLERGGATGAQLAVLGQAVERPVEPRWIVVPWNAPHVIIIVAPEPDNIPRPSGV